MAKKSIDLSEQVNIGQMVARRVAEAFKYGIECDIIHGKMLAGGSEQGINKASDTQNYVFGTRRITPYGRVFRYAKAGVEVGSMKRGVYGYNQLVAIKAGDASAAISAVIAGATVLTLTVTAEKVGVDRDGKIAKDELIGGYISIYTSASDRPQRRIVGNSALAANGVTFTIILDEALPAALTGSTACEILANPYSDVRTHETTQYGIYSSVLGMPTVVATVGQYFWIQTWGILRVTPTGAELGANPGERMFLFGSNGSLISAKEWADDTTHAYHSYQPGGFIMERTDGDAGSAAPFVMLQISP